MITVAKYGLKNYQGEFYTGSSYGVIKTTKNESEAATFNHPREAGNEKKMMGSRLNSFELVVIGESSSRVGRIVIHGEFCAKDHEKVSHLWDGTPKIHYRYKKVVHLPIQTLDGRLVGNDFYPDPNGDKTAVLCNRSQDLLPFKSRGVYSSHRDNARTYEILIVPFGTVEIHYDK